MRLFDWLFGNGSKGGEEIAETVADAVKTVVKDTAGAYGTLQIQRAVTKMRATVTREVKLSAASKASLNANLDLILQAIEAKRDAS